jgi:hypothetical protein
MAKRERIDVSGTRIEIILKLCSKMAEEAAEEKANAKAQRGEGTTRNGNGTQIIRTPGEQQRLEQAARDGGSYQGEEEEEEERRGGGGWGCVGGRDGDLGQGQADQMTIWANERRSQRSGKGALNGRSRSVNGGKGYASASGGLDARRTSLHARSSSLSTHDGGGGHSRNNSNASGTPVPGGPQPLFEEVMQHANSSGINRHQTLLGDDTTKKEEALALRRAQQQQAQSRRKPAGRPAGRPSTHGYNLSDL